MENPGNQSGESAGPVEDPPPPAPVQDQSTSESSSQQQPQPRPQPPLSPLTGCYLLIVVGEPHSERHKEIILQKIAKAFLSWDVSECHVSLEKELQVITGHSPEGEEARYGERLIQYATENLVTEILIHPQLNTLHQCMKNLLSSFTKHRHIIHAGYTFAGNGSWILQDGTLSISDLVEALHETEVLRVLKAYENSVSVDIHCAPEGDWTTERFQREPVSKLCNIRINPGDVMTSGNAAISAFIDYLSPFLEPANIQQLLQPTDVVGNIRFTHPTLYVFPGGQGDAALFGINGFNMLIDGGFARKACFWDFARHLDRLDAVLLTRLNNSTVNGISAVLQRKKMNHVYPQIGHFFCNLQDRKIALSPDGDKDKDSLIVNLAEEGQEIVANLRHLALKPHPCYRDGNQVDPVNLYHKVGHGKLDMYVISPARDSQAVKDFLAKWSSNDSHLFSNTGRKSAGKAFEFPLQNLVSICALLVWQPANPSDTITRILFPGSTPQHKIFEGLEKLRHLEFLKHPVCSAKSISPSASTLTVSRSVSKTRQVKPADNKLKETKTISKPQPKTVKAKTPPKDVKQKLDTNKLAELENGVEEPLKKLDNRILSKDEQIENIKKEIQTIEQAETEEHKKKIVHRSKYDMRNVKSKVDSRAPSKSIDRKKPPEKKAEGDASPPATPKKGLTNGTATKAEKAKVPLKTSKAASPSSTPAKSAKEANNRKVVEARVTSRSSSRSVTRKKEETPPPPPPPPAKVERKPISRRPKAPPSPVKTSAGRPAKPDADSVPKKAKTKPEVDSGVVKAVSQTVIGGLVKGAATEKTESRGEGMKIEIKKLEAETTENKETDEKAVKNQPESAQEEEEEEEYLIVTKEESTEESANEKENEEEAQTEGEGEMKKLLREEKESEKRREVEGRGEPREEEDRIEETEDRGETEEGEEQEVEEREAEKDRAEEKVAAEEKTGESPEHKSPERASDVRRLTEVDEGIDLKEPGSKEHREGESLPEEKISNTVETSATTAPTLPEDERIEEPMRAEEVEQPEEVQEVVEEKYIQEETKEEKQQEDEPAPPQAQVPTTIDIDGSPVPVPRKHPRGVVKTPDEVADLPMHEEVDPRMYASGEFTRDLQQKKPEEDMAPEERKADLKAMIKGEANFLDEEEPDSGKEAEKPDPIREAITSKYLNIIDELEKSATESRKDENEKPEKAEADSPPQPGTDVFERRESKTDDARKPVGAPAQQASKIMPEDVEDARPVSGKATPVDPGEQLPRKSTPVDAEREPSGKSAPVDLRKEPSGSVTPADLGGVPSGKSTPVEITRGPSGQVSPAEFGKEPSGKSTPADMARELSGKSTPADMARELSGKSIPGDFSNEPSGKSTPADVVREPLGKSTPTDYPKEASGKWTPVESPLAASGKSTPADFEREPSGKSTPANLAREPSGKSTPVDVAAELSGKSTPANLAREPSGKSTPVDVAAELSGKSTPAELGREPSGKLTPADRSGKATPVDVEKEPVEPESELGRVATPDAGRELYGKSTPAEMTTVPSGKSTPLEIAGETFGKATPVGFRGIALDVGREPSGKSTPVAGEELLREKITEEHSGKSSPLESTEAREPVKDIIGKLPSSQEEAKEIHRGSPRGSTPQELPEDISSPLHGKDISGEMTKPVSAAGSSPGPANEFSRNLTPQVSGKEVTGEPTPQDLSKGVSGKSSPLDFGMSTPLEVKETRSGISSPVDSQESPQGAGKVSGKSTPQEPEKEVSRKSSPDDLQKLGTSGKSTPQEPENEVSRKSTPLDAERDLSGKSTPLDSGKEIPRTSPLEVGEGTPERSTPVDVAEDVGRKPSPREMKTDLPAGSPLAQEDREKPDDDDGKSTTVALEKEPSPERGREASGKSTPLDVGGDSLKSTAQDESREISARSTPQKLEAEEQLEKEASPEGRSTLADSEKEKMVPPVSGSSEDPKKLSEPSTPEKDSSRRASRELTGNTTPEPERKGSAGSRPPTSQKDTASLNGLPEAESEGKPASEKDELERVSLLEKEGRRVAVVESSISDSASSCPGEKDVSGKSTPFSTDKEISGKVSPVPEGKPASDSFSLALAEKGTSGTCSLEKETSEKVSSPSPVDISPLSLDEIRELKDEPTKERLAGEIPRSPLLGRVKREGPGSSGTSTPDGSHRERSESSLANGMESEEELEKGTLESERQEKESQILDVSSGEEEELKALGEEEDGDSEPELRKNDLDGATMSLATEIAKGAKEDINNLVKIGGEPRTEEDPDSERKSGVRRMLVTASSEDGGTETEICLQGGVKVAKEGAAAREDADADGEFSNLILQARREYNNQRSRKTSYNSSEELEEAEEAESVAGEEEEELGTLLMQARKELEFVRSKSRERREGASERAYQTTKTTTRSETTRMDEDYLITITTILTEEREEQEDGSVKVTTTKETTTRGGRDEGTVVTVNTNFERRTDDREDESSSQVNSSGEARKGGSREEADGGASREEGTETSRRTSASSIISQEDLVSRKDSAKIEDFRQSSTEMSPLKTTYITSHGDSEALMTSSFYGNLPTEDEMIGREFRKARGYESVTEIGANGERTERTYFYGGHEDAARAAKEARDRHRFVKTFYTEDPPQRDGEQSRVVHRYYVPDIPEEEAAVERTRFVQRFYEEEASLPEAADKFRFVEAAAEEPPEHLDFAKAVDEHVSARGEYLGKEFQQDVAKYANGKSKPEVEEEAAAAVAPGPKKDVIEDWGKPLGLPLPPKGMNRTYPFPGQNISTTSSLSTPTDTSDSVTNWGQPMSLPSPAPPAAQNGTVENLPGKPGTKETPKKEKRVQPPKRTISGDNKSSGNNTPNRRSESPVKQVERRTPSAGRTAKSASNSHVYLDLTYVPHHGNSYYSNVEFFKRVRARYYVFSGTEPSKEVYNALLEAKQTWDDKKLEVTIIPTYDTDVLGYWVAENEEVLAKHKIDLSPSASRCTINLQDHETSCSAYRLEF